jgi:hypothetical protein
VTSVVPAARSVSPAVAPALAYGLAAGSVAGLLPGLLFAGMVGGAVIALVVVATTDGPRVGSSDASAAGSRARGVGWRSLAAGLVALALAAAYVAVFMRVPQGGFLDGGPCEGPLHSAETTLFPPQVSCVLGDSVVPLVAAGHFVVLALIVLLAAALMVHGLVAARPRPVLSLVVACWVIFAVALGVSSAVHATAAGS